MKLKNILKVNRLKKFRFLNFLDYQAFTLAEVLITLLIIGVVASLVIPAFINDIQKKDIATTLQKA